MFALPAHELTEYRNISGTHNSPQIERTKKEYALMIKAVRDGYDELPNGAKFFYEHLVECDYPDAITKLCKGYVFRKVRRLAKECHCGESTVYRYLAQLKNAGLIRIKRRGDIPYIHLLNISEEKLSTYRNEPKFSKEQNDYKRKLLTNRRIIANVGNVDFLFSAREYTCYERLVAWGYHPTQAIRDITHPDIGVGEIEQQLENLHCCIRAGRTIRACAQWLNWAIRAKFRINEEARPSFPAADQVAQPKQHRECEVDYELVTDERGYEVYRPKNILSVAAQEAREAVEPALLSTLYHSEACGRSEQLQSQPGSTAGVVRQQWYFVYFCSMNCLLIQQVARGRAGNLRQRDRALPPRASSACVKQEENYQTAHTHSTHSAPRLLVLPTTGKCIFTKRYADRHFAKSGTMGCG